MRKLQIWMPDQDRKENIMKLIESTNNPIVWMQEKSMTCCNATVELKFNKKNMEWTGACDTCQTAWTIAISTFQIIKN